MKKITRILILLVLLGTLIIPTTAFASGFNDDKVIFGGNYVLDEGETLNGDLVVFGGNVILRKDSTINGDTVIFGGTVTSNGTITGNLVALGGIVKLQNEALVKGDLTAVGSSFDQDPGAKINGNIITESDIPVDFNLPKSLGLLTGKLPLHIARPPLVSASWFIFRILIWTGLAVLIALFIQEPAAVINKTAFKEPLISIAVGLGITLVSPLVLIALIITILLSPVSLIGLFALIAAWVVGLVAISIEVGRRLLKLFDQTWQAPLMAALGMFILSLFFNGFNRLVPCVGWLPKFVLGAWAIGAVALTRFGTHPYPEEEPAPTLSAGAIPADFPPAEPAEKEVDATPAAKKLAAEENLDLKTVTGTGSDGRITITDVRKALKERK